MRHDLKRAACINKEPNYSSRQRHNEGKNVAVKPSILEGGEREEEGTTEERGTVHSVPMMKRMPKTKMLFLMESNARKPPMIANSPSGEQMSDRSKNRGVVEDGFIRRERSSAIGVLRGSYA